jgi:hypothetical protein
VEGDKNNFVLGNDEKKENNCSISDSNKSFCLHKSVLNGSLPPVKVKKHGTILPLSNMPSWHIQGHILTVNL